MLQKLMKAAALGLAGIFFLTVVYISFFRDNTYAAVSVGSSHSPIQVELKQDGTVKEVNDPTGQVAKEAWTGRTFEEIIPELTKHSNQAGESEIIITSTYQKKDNELVKKLLADLQRNTNKAGIVYLKGDIDDYREAKKNNKSLNAHVMEQANINLWEDAIAKTKTPEEKRTQLGLKASYYQSNDDLSRRNEEKRDAKEKRLAREKRETEEKKKEEDDRKAAEQRQAQRKTQESASQNRTASQPRRNTAQPARQYTRQPVKQTQRSYQNYNRNYDDDDWDDDWDDDDDDD